MNSEAEVFLKDESGRLFRESVQIVAVVGAIDWGDSADVILTVIADREPPIFFFISRHRKAFLLAFVQTKIIVRPLFFVENDISVVLSTDCTYNRSDLVWFLNLHFSPSQKCFYNVPLLQSASEFCLFFRWISSALLALLNFQYFEHTWCLRSWRKINQNWRLMSFQLCFNRWTIRQGMISTINYCNGHS